MNPPEDSIEILISTVYQRNLSSDETIRYEQLMEGPLGLFLGIEGTTERGHQLMVILKMKKIFGIDVTEHVKRTSVFQDQMQIRDGRKSMALPGHFEWPPPPGGTQTLPHGFKDRLQKIGLLAHGGALEQNKRQDYHHRTRKERQFCFSTENSICRRCTGRRSLHNDDWQHIFTRPGRGVNINNLFYRFSQLAELEVAYNMTQLNCDVCSTFLMTGWTNWSTMKKFHMPFTHVSLPVTEGQITRLTLEQGRLFLTF